MRLSTQLERGITNVSLVFGEAGDRTSAARLGEAGLQSFGPGGDHTLGMLMTNDEPTTSLLLGAVLAGVRVVSLPLPPRSGDPLEYAAFLRGVCHSQGVTRIVARDDVAELLATVDVPALPHSRAQGTTLAAPQAEGFELVQFSSGSTGRPKGVSLSDAALGANVDAMLNVVRPRPGDATVSWLPLSHDMGLVAMLLTSLAAGQPEWVGTGDVVLLTPEQFLRSPRTWIDALDHWKGTVTAAPDFGYRLASRQRSTTPDLSHVRCAIVGAEIVRASTLAAFCARYEPAGLAPQALCPAYGMAELGVAATMTRPGDGWREVLVGVEALADRRVAPPGPGQPQVDLVSSGPPLPGYQLTSDGGDDGLGQLRVFAPAVGTDAERGGPLTDADGGLTPGDLGFLDDDGWSYVCGRTDDHIVAHGRNLYAPAIESSVARLPGVREGRVTAVGAPSGEWLIAAEVARGQPTPASHDLKRAIQHIAVDEHGARPDEVLLLAPGHLPLTSSGKLQRSEVLRRWVAGSWADAIGTEGPPPPILDR